MPHIELVPNLEHLPRGVSGVAIAQTSFYGLRLSFCSSAIGLLSDEDVQTLVVHEIAHVYLWADDPKHGHQVDLAEEGVTWRIERWGFDKSSLDDAIAALVRTHVV